MNKPVSDNIVESKKKEMEKKFTVIQIPKPLFIKRIIKITQGYINDSDAEIRVRKEEYQLNGNEIVKYTLTIKRNNKVINGILVRDEDTRIISKEEYEKKLRQVSGNLIIKTRYIISLENNIEAEIDVYGGILGELPLIIAEVEFNNPLDIKLFKQPNWFVEDVTDDIRYRSTTLVNILSLEEARSTLIDYTDKNIYKR